MDDFHLHSSSEEEFPFLTPESFEEVRENLQNLRDRIMSTLPADQLSQAQIQDILKSLPRLTEQQLLDLGHKDSSCPICITPYLAIIAEEEMALAMDSPAHPVEELGVTQLSESWQCGHIFCRRDISKWILEAHDSCPMCRRLLVRPTPSEQQQQPSEPTLDQDDLLVSLQRQIAQHARLLQSLNVLGSLPVITRPQNSRREEAYENGSEFSGMYS